VEYFCSIRHVIDALALCKDSLGRTALHYVSSVEIVKLLPLSDLLATDNHGRTVLHTATINGYFDVIDYFCDTISSAHLIHSKDENGCTPLHYAPNKQIARRIVESLENLSEKRQYVLKRNNRQRTVLHSAAHNGRCEVISYLCELISQKEMLLADDQCKTALHYAKDSQVAKLLLDLEPRFIFVVDKCYCTALHLACYEGRNDVVAYICNISISSDIVWQKDNQGRTPLHLAFDYKTALILLESVPDYRQFEYLMTRDNHGCTALHAAAHLAKSDIVELLCKTYAHGNWDFLSVREINGRTALHFAQDQMIARLILEAVDPNRKKEYVVSTVDNQSCTVLHIAANENKVDIVEYLCRQFSSDSEFFLKLDQHGYTALHYAHSWKVAELLIKSVAKKNQRKFILSADGEEMCTALHAAVGRGSTGVVDYLCTSQPYVNELLQKKNVDEQTALHYARHKPIAQLLLESIRPDKQRDFLFDIDVEHNNPLHSAAFYGAVDVVDYLSTIIMKYEGNLLQKNIIGCTAFHYALNGAVAEKMVAFLKSSEARELVFSVDEYFQTVLHLATQESRNNLLRYLCDQYPGLLMKTDSSGKTALHYVLSRRTALPLCSSVEPGRLRDLLLIRDQDGQTALHSAVEDNNLDVVKVVYESLMVEEKLNTIRPPAPFSNKLQTRSNYFVDRLGRTPLHTAAIAGHAPLIKYLCNQLKDDFEMILARDAYMRTALHYAATPNIAWLLFEHLRRHQRQRLILSRDIYKLTAVAAAHHEQRYAVQKYLCKVLDLSTELKPKVTSNHRYIKVK